MPGPEDRVWRSFTAEARAALEHGLSPTDLQTLLLAVARRRAGAVTAARLLRRWQEDRFVRPSAADPRLVSRVEARLWDLLPPLFSGVELSPVVPLGTSSAVGLVDQHRVVSTVRGSEVASDPTNALAVEAALRRRAAAGSGRVHVAACQRVVRAQRFGPGASAHFRLFALVSTGRDTGSGRTEAEFLVEHLAFLARAARTVAPRVPITLAFTPFRSCAVRERFHDVVLPAVRDRDPEIVLVEDTTRTQGSTYYDGAALSITASGRDGDIDLGDGGLTTWTAQLLGDAKERCLVSCIATERLTELGTSA